MVKPRYMQVAQSLMKTIHEGRHPIGSLLPTELQIADQYGVSRHTVREALKQLQKYGMVSRRVGIGTRVESVDTTSGYRQTLDSIDDLVQFGKSHNRRVELVENTVLDIETARELGCSPGSKWLWIGSVRWDEESDPRVPVCWTDSYVDPLYQELGTIIKEQTSTLMCSIIEERYRRRAVMVKQSISAIEMPQSRAGVLGVKPASSALKVVRQYFDEMEDIFIVTRTYHPSGRFTLHMLLSRIN